MLTYRAGMLAGPLYVLVSLAEATLRPGFDPTRHAWSQLALGDLGWIHIANLIVSGLLVVAGAAGLWRRLRGPAIGLALYGLGMVGAGVFRADPGNGFPPGTPDGAGPVSTHGILHFALAGIGFLGLVTAALLLARRRVLPILSATTGVVFLVAFAALASAGGAAWSLLFFTAAVILASAWLTLAFARLRTANSNR